MDDNTDAEPAAPDAYLLAAVLTDVWRTERPRIVAAIAPRTGDLQAAEDAVQEAFAAASVHWVRDGVPTRPGAWLTTAAWRKAVDEQRRQRFPLASASEADRETAGPRRALADVAPSVTEDDLLAMMLVCCHPALSAEAQVALTLRHVAGLRDDRIAALLLVSPATVTKRLVRARAKIGRASIPFGVPDAQRLQPRPDQLRTVIYLIFTEGYLPAGHDAPGGDDLCAEAVWLALQSHELLPDDDETTGLAALLLLQHARAGARRADGEIVTFAAQDRSRWDRGAVDRTKALLATTACTPPGPYRIEAAIALLHVVGPKRRGDRLAADQPAVRHPAAARPDSGRRREPCHGARACRRPGTRAGVARPTPRRSATGRLSADVGRTCRVAGAKLGPGRSGSVAPRCVDGRQRAAASTAAATSGGGRPACRRASGALNRHSDTRCPATASEAGKGADETNP